MKPGSIEFLPVAAAEYRAAAVRYNEEREGLGAEFAVEVEASTAKLARFPDLGRIHHSKTRKLELTRFPYSIIYRVTRERFAIVAAAHHKRRPGYWIPRQ